MYAFEYIEWFFDQHQKIGISETDKPSFDPIVLDTLDFSREATDGCLSRLAFYGALDPHIGKIILEDFLNYTPHT